MEKDYYSCEEVAELMGMKITTIRSYCKEGKIPCIKIGRGYHIAVEDFNGWCKGMKNIPPGTELKEYLIKLKESETKYRNLVHQSLDGIIMTDFKGTVTLANPSFCQMVGSTEEAVVGANFTKYYRAEERAQAVEDHMRRMAGAADRKPRTAQLLKKDGKNVFVEILGTPIREAGAIVGVQKIIRDITGRKRLEQELETILELVPDALMITDFKGKIYRVNQSVKNFSGYTREELLRTKQVVNMYYYPEDREKALAMLKENSEFHNFEFTARIKGDVAMPAEMSAKIVELGSEKYIESLVRDITERKRMQDELRDTTNALERFFNRLNFGASRLDQNLQVIFANKWIGENIPSISLGKVCSTPFGQTEGLCPWCPTAKSLRSGKPEKAEAKVKFADGTVHELSFQAYPVRDAQGNIRHIAETILDLAVKQERDWNVLSF